MNKAYVGSGIIIVIIVIAAIAWVGMHSPATTSATTSIAATTSPYATSAGSSVVTTAATTTNAVTTSINSTANAGYSVGTAHNSTLGDYLVNSTGFTLYYFTADTPGNGTSACYGTCANYWPPDLVSNVTVQKGLDMAYFSTINRTGGGKQLAYNGWPLYRFGGDKAAGQMNGNGLAAFGGTWHVATPALNGTK